MADFAITPRVPPSTNQEQNLSPTSPATAQLTPIEGTIDSSGLSMFRRLLMKGATALGIEITSPPATNTQTTDPNLEERTLSLTEKILRSVRESRVARHLVAIGESIVDMAYGAWERVTGSGTHARSERSGSYDAPSRQSDPDTSPLRVDVLPTHPSIDLKKSLDDEGSIKEREVISVALHQVAEAVRRKDEEKKETAHSEERARQERTQHARNIIEAIDARGGTIANNPKVQAILNSLGTPYDSIQQAIAQVEALQREEEELKPN